jgi:thiamine kinase-like enzyme
MLDKPMIVKNPAWSSLAPKLPQFRLADSTTSAYFEHQLKMNGQLFKVEFDQKSTRAYLFENSENKNKYFIKKISVETQRSHQDCEHLTQWVSSQSYIVNTSISHFFNKEDLAFYYIYPYIQGTRIIANAEHIIYLGTALAKLHTKLKNYPHLQQINQNTIQKIKILGELRREILNDQHVQIPHVSFVKKLAKDYNYECINYENSQVIHGDLNAGNLLFAYNSICFFDFEDALHSFLPITFDILFLMERIIFNQILSDSERLNLGRILLKSYKDAGGTYKYQENDECCLTLMSLRAFCLLTIKMDYGHKVLHSEWDKFFELSQKGISDQKLIKKILQG